MGETENDWRAALAGDGEAFGRIFDACRDRVFRHASRLVASRGDAEDVTATAFLELWRRRDAVRLVDGSPLPWLLLATTNVARNQVRATLRYRRMLARLPRAEGAAFSPEPGIDPDLVRAIRSLPPIDAQLLALVALEDLSIAAAAEALGITPAAAKARLHRCRHRLRERLRQPGPTGHSSGAGAVGDQAGDPGTCLPAPLTLPKET